MPLDKEKRNKRQNEWIKQNTERINFTMPLGTKDKIIAAAEAAGVKPAEYIRRAIHEKLIRDNGIDTE